MIEVVKGYIENRIQLLKLEMVTIAANVASGLVSSFLILIFILFIFLMLSLSLGFWIASLLDNHALGFLIIGGFYLILFMIFMLVSRKGIENKVKDIIVSSALSSDNESY